MYLPEKIMKILSKISKPYTVHYKGDRIYSIEVEEESMKIYSTSSGCKIDVKGSSINLGDLDSLEKLLIRFDVVSKKNSKTKVSKMKEDVSELFSETKKEIAIKYYRGYMVSLLVKEPQVTIKKTEFGYKIRMGAKEIAVENLNSMRVLLEKMNVIPIMKVKKEKRNKSKDVKNKNEIMPGVEQLTLEI